MRSIFKPFVTTLFSFTVLFLVHSCKKEELPSVSTSFATNITGTSASSGGNILTDGGADVTSRGICWGLNENPSISDQKTIDGAGTGRFISNLTGLTGGSIYHIRAYATNSVGTAYGTDLSFTTQGKMPDCISQPATNISASGATLNGTVNANYLSTTVTFEYGTTTSYGLTATAAQSLITGNSNTLVIANLTGLAPRTTYHFRIKAVNSLGTVFGSDMVFETKGQPPAANFTASQTAITTSHSIQFTDQSANNPSNWLWNFGDGTTSTQRNPLKTYSAAGTYTVSLLVTNQYGSDTETKTNYISVTDHAGGETGTFIDTRDGKTYKWVKIGTMTWMAENLAYLPSLSQAVLVSYTDPCFYVYGYGFEYLDNVTKAKATYNYQTYGVLYNWPAALGACPLGWHLPTDDEWYALAFTLDINAQRDRIEPESFTAGIKLKEIGTSHWVNPNDGDEPATNESGFTALPGGQHFAPVYSSYTYGEIGYHGYWWSATEYDSHDAWLRHLSYSFNSIVRPSYDKRSGFSVRCIKD